MSILLGFDDKTWVSLFHSFPWIMRIKIPDLHHGQIRDFRDSLRTDLRSRIFIFFNQSFGVIIRMTINKFMQWIDTRFTWL